MDKERENRKKSARDKSPHADVLGLKSIQFRTWLSFVTLTAITLIMLWFVQILFYTITFRNMSKNELRRAGDKLSESITEENYTELLSSGAIVGGYSALILTREEEVVYAVNSNGTDVKEKLDEELMNVIAENSEEVYGGDKAGKIYTRSVGKRGEFVVYARQLKQGEYLLCLVRPYEYTGVAVGVLRDQLVVVTVICMLLSMLLALTFSRAITKPIAQFSHGARKLASGDFSVRFEGNGMTEIDELAETLNYATEEMGKTEELRRDFFANVSHDLRTPLTMVRAYAEMIKDVSGDVPEKREAHAKIIMDEADRLTMLVEDILDLSKLQAGTNERNSSLVDAGALTKAVLERFDGICRSGGYTLSADIDEGAMTVCDVKRIEQVLYNLVSNAMNYTGADKKIAVRVKKKESTVRFEISDSGKGIAGEEIDSVWDRYYRSSQARRAKVGTGLGLSIVKNILLQHGANYGIDSVTADDPEGRPTGTTIYFELPLASEEDGDDSKDGERDKEDL